MWTLLVILNVTVFAHPFDTEQLCMEAKVRIEKITANAFKDSKHIQCYKTHKDSDLI